MEMSTGSVQYYMEFSGHFHAPATSILMEITPVQLGYKTEEISLPEVKHKPSNLLTIFSCLNCHNSVAGISIPNSQLTSLSVWPYLIPIHTYAFSHTYGHTYS